MKKNTIKAFTLVEMLIVIVIIGILIAALMPRMQSAQWRARDVARKNDLSQIQAAIVTSYQDKWAWPKLDRAKTWLDISEIKDELITAWMSSVPRDPIATNKVTGLWSNGFSGWEYAYLVAKRNWTDDWWFVLMAKTEIEWWSNWVVCTTGTDVSKGYITNTTDLAKQVQTCTKMVKVTTWDCTWPTGWVCTYALDSELRYILLY